MNAGDIRNDTVDIYAMALVKDAFGAERETYDCTHVDVRCAASEENEHRATTGDEIIYSKELMIVMRRHWKQVINEHCRLKFRGEMYLVDSIYDHKEDNSISIRVMKVNE